MHAILVERKGRKEAKNNEEEYVAAADNRTKYTIMVDRDVLNQQRHLAIDKDTTVIELLNESAKSHVKTLSSSNKSSDSNTCEVIFRYL